MEQYFINCIRMNNDKIYCMSQIVISQNEFNNITKALANINKLKLLYEIPYSLKINYMLFEEYLNINNFTSDLNFEKYNNHILEINRLVSNILSSFNIIEPYFENILGKNMFKNDFKPKITSKHFDTTFEYGFLYNLRNFTLHNSIPITKLNFEFKGKEQNVKIFIDKKKLLEDSQYFRSIKDKFAKMPNEIDIVSIIKTEVPLLLEAIKKYIYTYYLGMKTDINLILSYQNKLRSVISSKWSDDELSYFISNKRKSKNLSNRLPSEFIKLFLSDMESCTTHSTTHEFNEV